MKRSLVALGAVVVAAAIGACDNKSAGDKPAPVASYTEYTDPTYGFKISHPENWVATLTTGRAMYYSTELVADGFSTFEPKGQRGAKIEVHAQPGDQALADRMLADLRGVFTDPDAVKGPEQTTINGMPATKISYGATLADEGTLTAERYVVVDGGMVTYLETAVIGTYADYAPIFDNVRKSFQPARAAGGASTDTSAVAGDTSARTPVAPRDSIVTDPPSTEMKTYSGSQFTMSYPANFDGTSNADGAIFSGARADSRVQVNVYDSKGVALDQIVEASKKNYGGRAATKTTVGGKPAYVFTYGSGGATARAYYVVSGPKLFVITATWFTAQSDLYQPAFEKMIASFRPKT